MSSSGVGPALAGGSGVPGGALAGGSGVTPGGGGDPGLAVLQAMVGWWDAPSYSGSGKLLNSGTAGSALDMSLINAPTFDTDHFVLNGTNQSFECADTSAVNFGANASYSLGAVFTYPSTPGVFAGLMGKGPGTGPAWSLVFFDGLGGWYWYTGSGDGSDGFTPAGSGVKDLVALTKSPTAVHGYAAGASSAFGSHTTSDDNTHSLTIGRSEPFSSWIAGSLYAAFITNVELSADDLAAIADHYGI